MGGNMGRKVEPVIAGPPVRPDFGIPVLEPRSCWDHLKADVFFFPRSETEHQLSGPDAVKHYLHRQVLQRRLSTVADGNGHIHHLAHDGYFGGDHRAGNGRIALQHFYGHQQQLPIVPHGGVGGPLAQDILLMDLEIADNNQFAIGIQPGSILKCRSAQAVIHRLQIVRFEA